jgi:RNA polymerase-binding protein DksA
MATADLDFDKLRTELQAERARLYSEVEQREDEQALTAVSADAELEELDSADAAAGTADRQTELMLRENVRDQIEKIDRALARIDSGEYGRCERCGKPIAAARLEALPYATLCITCAERSSVLA